MNNKTKLTFITVALSTFMLLAACNNGNQSSESSSEQPSISSSESSSEPSSSSSSSEPPKPVYTVEFKSEGVTLATYRVTEGGYAEYKGDLPLKESNSVTDKFRFSGWDGDLAVPITENKVFNAQFTNWTYTPEVSIDDFESYTESGDLIDEGWQALTYSSSGWTDDTKAAVSLSVNAADGNQALRLDHWSNGVGYKATKNFTAGSFNQSVNALNFKLMTPTYSHIKVLLEAKVRIAGKWEAPSFTYDIGQPATGEYLEYTIPLSDDGWALWREQGKTIKAVAGWSGVHQDDILKYLTKIEFYFEGNDRDKKGFPYIAFIDSVKFTTSETVEAERETIEKDSKPYKTYTGTLSTGNIIRLDIGENNSATAKIIDLETPVTINGNVALNDKEITFTSADNGQTITYKGRLTCLGQLINYVSATGTLANQVKDMGLSAVIGVDDFESYAENGVAYCENNKNKENRTGVYEGYYGEYYNATGSSDWGGNGWDVLPGDGEALQLVKDSNEAHSGEKFIKLTNNKNDAYRYIQWGLVDGSAERNYYRGATLSLWAKTDGFIPTFMVSCYSQTSPKNATKDDSVKKETFAQTGEINEWKHFEVKLDPQLVYYGYLIFMEKTQAGSDSYLLVDDVEIYGANPYAKYEVPEPEKGPEPVRGLNYTATLNGLINVDLEIKENNTATLSAKGLNISLNGTYTVDENDDLTFTFEGGITYKATISKDIKTLTYKDVDGDGIIADALINLSFKMINYADNAETYLTDGIMYYQSNKSEANLSGARGAYYCDFKHGNETYTSPVGGSTWILMGGQGDQLQLDKINSYEGKQSLKMKKSTAGDMRYMEWGLYKGTAEAKTGFDRFSVALKNVNTETKVKIMVYKIQKVTPTTQFDPDCVVTKEITLPAGQGWKVYDVVLNPSENYYGYCIYLDKDTVIDYINVDDARFYKSESNPSMYFNSPKDLTLSNNNDSIKFNGGSNALVTCTAMSLSNFECRYSMQIVEGKQIMTLMIAGNEIKGEYTIDMAGKVTFKITEIDSSLEAIYPAGTEFSNK